MFAANEEKGLVLPDWAAHGESVVLIACLGLGAGERVGVLEELVVVEVIGRFVEGGGARFDGEVCSPAGVMSEFGRSGSLEGKILNGVDRQNDARNGRDATLVHSRNAPPEVIVVSSLDLPVDGVRSGPVDAGHTGAAAGRKARETGGLGEHLGEVAATVRHRLTNFFRQGGWPG